MEPVLSTFKIARLGWRFILPLAIIGLVFVAFRIPVAGGVFLAIAGFLVFFFRDPDRRPPRIPGAVVSPADGKIVSITEIPSGQAGIIPGTKIDIFMSVFNVHINRAPVDATVVDVRYRPGKFLNAMSEKSSENNEANFLYLRRGEEEFLVTQIAGLIARRIVCPLRVNDTVERGGRIGLIGMGSRVEVTIPPGAEIKAVKGQTVTAGESVLAILGGS